MITVQNLSKQFGKQAIFQDVAFSLDRGERAGVTGRNGHGKSTLFRILTGQETSDNGQIVMPKGYRMGFLAQDVRFSRASVLEEGCAGLPPDRHDEEWKVKKVLTGLGFLDTDFNRPPSEFSGGYLVRLSLAKVLLSEPNLLLLDEPTNFLDILSIRWLERFLKEWKGELMVISHDRDFVDSVTESILGIHRLKIRKIRGKTGDYYSQIEREEEIHEKNRVNTEKRKKQIETFITRFRAKARQANLVQSRIKALEKMETLEKLPTLSNLSFDFADAPFPAKYVLETRGLGFSYSGTEPFLLNGLNLTVGRDDRICVIGKNGKGKTTFLKLLAGELNPVAGEIKIHPAARTAYFEQGHTAILNPHLSVEEEILSSLAMPEKKKARDICGAMMFSGDAADKKISVISGGEKCRVLLGKLLAAPSNLLLLDEPTHHLDMESSDALCSAVEAFEGASIIVTHNEHLLRRLANRLIVFHRDRIILFEGGYEDFLGRVGWDEEEAPRAKEPRTDDGTGEISRKDVRKIRAEFFTRRSKALSPLQEKMDRLEKEICALEERIKKETDEMLLASAAADIASLRRLTQTIGEARARVDALYPEIFEAQEQYERSKVVFEEEEKILQLG